jgi:hypothetical protein
MVDNFRADLNLGEVLNFFSERSRRKKEEELAEQQRQQSISLADIIGNANQIASNIPNINRDTIDQGEQFRQNFLSLREQVLGLDLDLDTQLKMNQAFSQAESALNNRLNTITGGEQLSKVQRNFNEQLGILDEETLRSIEEIDDPTLRAKAFNDLTGSAFGTTLQKEQASIIAKNRNIDLITENVKKLAAAEGEVKLALKVQEDILLGDNDKTKKAESGIEVLDKVIKPQVEASKDLRNSFLKNSQDVDRQVTGIAGETSLDGLFKKNVVNEVTNRQLFGFIELEVLGGTGSDTAIEQFFNDPDVDIPDETRQQLIDTAKVDYDEFRAAAPEGLRRSLAAETSDFLQFQGIQNSLKKDFGRRFALDKAMGNLADDSELGSEYIARNFPETPPFLINSLPQQELNNEAIARVEEAETIDSEDSNFLAILLSKIKDPVKQSVEDMGTINPFRAINQANTIKQAILGDRTPIQGAKDAFRLINNSQAIKEGIRNGSLKARDIFDRLLNSGLVAESDFGEFMKLFRKEQKDNKTETVSN